MKKSLLWGLNDCMDNVARRRMEKMGQGRSLDLRKIKFKFEFTVPAGQPLLFEARELNLKVHVWNVVSVARAGATSIYGLVPTFSHLVENPG